MNKYEELAKLICEPPKQIIKMFLGYYNDDVNLFNENSSSVRAINAYIALRSVFVFHNLSYHGRNPQLTLDFMKDVRIKLIEILSMNNPYNLNIEVFTNLEDKYLDAIEIHGYNANSIMNVFYNSLPFVENRAEIEKILAATEEGINKDVRYIMTDGHPAASQGCGCLGCMIPTTVCLVFLVMLFLFLL